MIDRKGREWPGVLAGYPPYSSRLCDAALAVCLGGPSLQAIRFRSAQRSPGHRRPRCRDTSPSIPTWSAREATGQLADSWFSLKPSQPIAPDAPLAASVSAIIDKRRNAAGHRQNAQAPQANANKKAPSNQHLGPFLCHLGKGPSQKVSPLAFTF